MSLEKLTIDYEKGRKGEFNGKIKALFNPSQLTHAKNVTWTPLYTAGASTSRPGFKLMYQSAAPQTLTLELFFDAYATATSESILSTTNKVSELASLDQELHRPPVCKLSWGKDTLFQGVLQQASRTFLLFLEDGTPVRATMNCTFMEYPGEGNAKTELHSADVAKQYIVRPGDTLMSIAAAMYGDVAVWRRIADVNRIDNPRRLMPGQTLSIPRIR